MVSLHLRLSGETRGMVGEREFTMMKRSAILINTARGPIVDEAALVRGLARGRPAAAILDVFREEPLPAEHPLRGKDNVWITPHVAGIGTPEALARDFAENYRRFRADEPLQNLVDRARGY